MEEDYGMMESGDLRDSLTVLIQGKKIKAKEKKKKKEKLLSVTFQFYNLIFTES